MHLSALTFGTLLSSQESDAHRASHSRSKLRGNPPNFTVPTRAGQIGSFRPSLPARLSVRNPPRRVSASETFREFAGATGRFRVPLRSNRKNTTGIPGSEPNRGPGPSGHAAPHGRSAGPPPASRRRPSPCPSEYAGACNCSSVGRSGRSTSAGYPEHRYTEAAANARR